MAQAAVQAHGISVSSACATFAISQTCYHYKAKLSEDNERVADWLNPSALKMGGLPFHLRLAQADAEGGYR
ncbi:hypothetical protein SAMN04515617_10629 [Collimonas sp. OK242]|jgi:hypothetical protein|nr:hypothetical protein SAMN04515617_10629 [Collimonas sp. OK242]